MAVWIGVAALLVTVLILVVVVLAARAFLGPGPTAAAAPPTPTLATLPPEAVSTGSLPPVMARAEACAAIPSGTVPAALAITSTSSGLGTDLKTGYSTPFITMTLASPVSSGTPAFTLVTAVLPFGATAPSGGSPVDRAGTVQLIAYWDGTHWFAALRSWSGSAWSTPQDSATQGVDVVQHGAMLTLFWQGLTNGDRVGEIIGVTGGCSEHDLDANLTPTGAYSS